MSYIVQYENDEFIAGMSSGEKQILFTRIRQKGLKHGFIQKDMLYQKWVNLSDFIIVKKYYEPIDNHYRVKYKEHFFYDDFETEKKILIANHGALSHYFSELYNMDYDYYNSLATKYVFNSEVTPIDIMISDNLGMYQAMVVIIEDEKNELVKISTNIDLSSKNIHSDFSNWKKENTKYVCWVSKKEVFRYKDNQEPLRY